MTRSDTLRGATRALFQAAHDAVDRAERRRRVSATRAARMREALDRESRADLEIARRGMDW